MRKNQPESITSMNNNIMADSNADRLQSILQEQGTDAAVEALIEIAKQGEEPRKLLDALLLKARLSLGLPATGVIADQISPELKLKYEDLYVEAIRNVGNLLLEKGDIASAWPYFRVIGEKEPVRAAIEAFDPGQADEHTLGAIIDIAFQQQVHPVKGFAWILDRYGICSSISSFESLPNDETVRCDAATLLTKALYDQLQYSLMAEIERREGSRPDEGTSVAALIANRSWIYDDDAYAIDVSHLSSVVRLSPLLKDESVVRLALELAHYGNGLSDRFRYDGLPPFEDIYADHSIYLKAILNEDNEDVENAITHFRNKLQPITEVADEPVDPLETLPAQTLVRLLARLNRMTDAIAVASEYLVGVPDSYLLCPSLQSLCIGANRLDLLAQAAAKHGDFALFLGSLIEVKPS